MIHHCPGDPTKEVKPQGQARQAFFHGAPEIFRVLGKRRPEFVRPFVAQLQRISETDDNRVVRIHCLGAIRATVSG